MNDLQIREIQETDTPRLIHLMEELGYPISTETMLQRIHLYQDNPAYFSYVAELNNVIVGSISIVITEYFHREGRFARVTSLVIDNNYRQKGIGKQLMQHAEKIAADLNCSFIELSSGLHREKSGSHNFYLSLGYKDSQEKKKYFIKEIV